MVHESERIELEAIYRKLGHELSSLKRRQGAPSYNQIHARGVELLGIDSAVSKPSASDIFTGRRGPASLDRLLWLVRMLLSYDDGEEVAPPGRHDPRLQPWREQWSAIEAARAARRRRIPLLPVEAPPKSSGLVDETPIMASGVVPSEQGRLPLAVRMVLRSMHRGVPIKLRTLHASMEAGPHWYAGELRSMAISADGRHLACGDQRGALWFWDLRGHVPAADGDLHDAHSGTVRSVAFSPDSRVLATAGEDGHVWLWDTFNRTRYLHPLDHEGRVRSITFSPNGRHLVTAGDMRTRIWSVETRYGGDLQVDGSVRSVAFCPNSTLVALACRDGQVWLRDSEDRKQLGEFIPHEGAVKSVAFSADGRQLVTVSETVRLWDAAELSRTPQFLRNYSDTPQMASFSPDNRLLAVLSKGGTVTLWSRDGHTQVGAPLSHEGGTSSVVFSPDASVLAVATGSRVYLYA